MDAYAGPLADRTALTATLQWYRAMSGPDFAAVAQVAVPTTYLWSDGDVAVGRAAAQACTAFVTGDFDLVVLEGVSHWVPDQAPQAVVEAVRRRAGPSDGGRAAQVSAP